MDFYDTLKKVCLEHDTSVSKLEKELGFSNGSLSKGIPRADRLYKISKHLQIPMEAFISDENWDELKERHISHQSRTTYPVYRVSAGNGCYNSQYADETISSTEDGFEFVEIVGDSMLPILEDGDIVKVELTTEVSPHDLSVVKIDGETSCVKYCEITDRGIWLKAENKAVYEDHFYSIQQVLTLPIVVIGRVVELRRKIK